GAAARPRRGVCPRRPLLVRAADARADRSRGGARRRAADARPALRRLGTGPDGAANRVVRRAGLRLRRRPAVERRPERDPADAPRRDRARGRRLRPAAPDLPVPPRTLSTLTTCGWPAGDGS